MNTSDISQLYLRDTYLNKNIPFLFNRVIIEYDLKSANTSLCKEYNLLPKEEIDKIEKKNKKGRVVTIGLLQKKDKKFKEALKLAFIDIRKRFFIDNNIKDEDILSIKKDAIFCLKEVQYTDFGKCKFVKKNVYTSYMYLNKLEFYYNSKGISLGDGGIIDVKGIDDEIVKKHQDFMLKFFKNAFKHFESSDQKTIFNFLKRFIDKYKNLELEVGYYREFDQNGIIRLNDSDETYDDVIFIPYEHKQEHINIDYNFFNILLPIVNMLL